MMLDNNSNFDCATSRWIVIEQIPNRFFFFFFLAFGASPCPAHSFRSNTLKSQTLVCPSHIKRVCVEVGDSIIILYSSLNHSKIFNNSMRFYRIVIFWIYFFLFFWFSFAQSSQVEKQFLAVDKQKNLNNEVF
jgi:hypothetical protein